MHKGALVLFLHLMKCDVCCKKVYNLILTWICKKVHRQFKLTEGNWYFYLAGLYFHD